MMIHRIRLIRCSPFWALEDTPLATLVFTHSLTTPLRLQRIMSEIKPSQLFRPSQKPMGAVSTRFTATTRLNRNDWGLNWNVALETGGWLVGDEMNIGIELEIVKQAEAKLEELEEEVALAA